MHEVPASQPLNNQASSSTPADEDLPSDVEEMPPLTGCLKCCVYLKQFRIGRHEGKNVEVRAKELDLKSRCVKQNLSWRS